MPRWCIRSVTISAGFLAGLELHLPDGLTCIIGPRGSGKSTLAEAIRFGVCGSAGASKPRLDLIQANLGSGVVTISTAGDSSEPSYTIRRAFRQPASLVTADGKLVTSVDLDRGTFLPLDTYSSAEIEAIADESLGARRRALLDELRGEELSRIQLSLGDRLRALEANADAIRAAQRQVADLTESVESLAAARAKLEALPKQGPLESNSALMSSSKQQRMNETEAARLTEAGTKLRELREEVLRVADRVANELLVPLDEDSRNGELMRQAAATLAEAVPPVKQGLVAVADRLAATADALGHIGQRLADAHAAQDAEFATLQSQDQAAGAIVRQRHDAERAVAELEALEARLTRARAQLEELRESRKNLKGTYLLERERVSDLREGIATRLQQNAGGSVRIRVLRNADSLGYRNALLEGLRGARVRNHDEILECLMRLRPEELAQVIADDDVAELEQHASLGTERCRRILDAYRANIDPLALEVVPIDDRIAIELNVSTNAHEPNYKDAAELSRGQKCTALLPLLLARRDSPLIVDQPEDNLDNHFIYATVVDSIRQLKRRRQMVFITHNANIPVLAEADLVVVMNSDGRRGYVERAGTLDECRQEIIDLLEGGREAFELRRRRYQGV